MVNGKDCAGIVLPFVCHNLVSVHYILSQACPQGFCDGIWLSMILNFSPHSRRPPTRPNREESPRPSARFADLSAQGETTLSAGSTEGDAEADHVWSLWSL